MDYLLLVPVLLLSFVVHEFAHAWVAWREGDPTAGVDPVVLEAQAVERAVHARHAHALTCLCLHADINLTRRIRPDQDYREAGNHTRLAELGTLECRAGVDLLDLAHDLVGRERLGERLGVAEQELPGHGVLRQDGLRDVEVEPVTRQVLIRPGTGPVDRHTTESSAG